MNKNVRQIVLPLIVAIIWGSAFIVQGSVASRMGAFTFNGVRALIASIVLGLTALFIDGQKAKKGIEYKSANRKKLFVGGICCGIVLFIASNVQQYGMFGTTEAGGSVLTEGDSAFITALYIILVPLCLIFTRKKPTFNVWLAVALAVFGLFFICNFTGGSAFTIYHVELFLCAVAFTGHILIIDYFTRDQDGIKLSCLQFLTMGVLSTICAFIFDDISFAVIGECIWQLLYVGIFSCAIAYTLQIVAQKGTNPTIVSILLSLESVFALACEFVIGLITGNVKPHTPLQLVGCGLMVLAIICAQFDFIAAIRNKKAEKSQ